AGASSSFAPPAATNTRQSARPTSVTKTEPRKTRRWAFINFGILAAFTFGSNHRVNHAIQTGKSHAKSARRCYAIKGTAKYANHAKEHGRFFTRIPLIN